MSARILNEKDLLEFFKEQKKEKELYNQICTAEGLWKVISLYLNDRDSQIPSTVAVVKFASYVNMIWARPKFYVSIKIEKDTLEWFSKVNWEKDREGCEVRYSDVKYLADLINKFVSV